jgi:hypothetical protein
MTVATINGTDYEVAWDGVIGEYYTTTHVSVVETKVVTDLWGNEHVTNKLHMVNAGDLYGTDTYTAIVNDEEVEVEKTHISPSQFKIIK